MKRLLSILGVVALGGSSTFSVIACKKNNGKSEIAYIDHELDQIANKTNEELVKNSLAIAKLLISSRHENLNVYAQDMLNWFINSTKDKFTAKTGAIVNLKQAKANFHRRNRAYTIDNLINIQSEQNNTVNWAYSDTGTLSNYLFNADLKDQVPGGFANDSNDNKIDSSRLYQLLLLNDKVKDKGYITDDKTAFGNADNFNVYEITRDATNMYALNTVNFLGQGFSMMSPTNAITGLASISKVFPLVRQDTFLGGQDDKLRKFIFQHLNIATTALFGTTDEKDLFARLADKTLLGDNYTKVLDAKIGKSLFEVLKEFDSLPNKIAMAGIFSPIAMDKLANISGVNIYAKFVELYDVFNAAIKASVGLDQQKFNKVLSEGVYTNLMARIEQLRKAEVQGSLWDILIMMINAFKNNQVSVVTFLGAFADFGAMFGSSGNDGTDQTEEQKTNVESLKTVAEFSDEANYNLNDFTDPKNGTIKAIDEGTGGKISYHDWVLMKLGMTKDGTGATKIKPGSMMSYMANWNTSGGMYDFLTAMFKSSDSLFTKWTNAATANLTNNYFDFLFRDDMWDIDPTSVTRVNTAGGGSKLTYTMTYNGLGDDTVNNQANLDKYHSTPLNIKLTSDGSNLSGTAPTGDEKNPNYSLEDWKNHDGLGTTFTNVKHTYTVTFDITPEGTVGKMADFIWKINGKRYY